MDSASSTLKRLRQSLVGIDPSLTPALPGFGREVGLDPAIDAALGGGLSCGALHEIAPVAPIHLGSASGLAMALATLSSQGRGETLWITTDFAVGEAGGLYGPGLEIFGLDPARLLVLRVRRAVDALWAMEEGLRCCALSGVVAELTGDGADADLTATRRLALAAREGKSMCLGLLLRHGASSMPSAAVTRWQIAAAPSVPDKYGGLGPARFDLSLVKNRRGPAGRWIIQWDHHEHVFLSSVSLSVAASPLDRSDRTRLVQAS
jgi:protein ImuA